MVDRQKSDKLNNGASEYLTLDTWIRQVLTTCMPTAYISDVKQIFFAFVKLRDIADFSWSKTTKIMIGYINVRNKDDDYLASLVYYNNNNNNNTNICNARSVS